jgi:hypothetical protein
MTRMTSAPKAGYRRARDFGITAATTQETTQSLGDGLSALFIPVELEKIAASALVGTNVALVELLTPLPNLPTEERPDVRVENALRNLTGFPANAEMVHHLGDFLKLPIIPTSTGGADQTFERDRADSRVGEKPRAFAKEHVRHRKGRIRDGVMQPLVVVGKAPENLAVGQLFGSWHEVTANEKVDIGNERISRVTVVEDDVGLACPLPLQENVRLELL